MRVSVVVPAYDAEEVLEDCVTSIAVQDVSDVEVIVVDDGSCDGTYACADELASRYGCVRLVRKDNGGVSSARNAGLAVATGEVVLFVDADDRLEPGALSYVADRYEREHPDCLVFGMRVEPESATPLTLRHRLAPHDATFDHDARSLLFREHSHPYAFRVAFRRDFLVGRGIAWDEGLSLGEDEAFLMLAYRLADRVVCSSKRLYVYRMSEASASHRDNASVDILPAKLDKHLALVASVMRSWHKYGVDGSCDADLLRWALDLLMLDVSRLRPKEQRAFYPRLHEVFVGYFGPDAGMSLATGATAACLGSIIGAEGDVGEAGPVVGRRDLVRFYLRSRGALAVAERALATLRGRGAY